MRDLYMNLSLDLPKIEITPNIQRLMWELSNYGRHKQKIVGCYASKRQSTLIAIWVH